VAPNTNSITDAFCTAQKKATADPDVYGQLGGTSTIGKALGRGMALVLSVWDDTASNMLWLDSDYPATMKSSAVGVARGSCATTSGVQSDLITSAANASVVFSNIKYGAIGSTVAKTTTSGPAAAVNAIKWKSF
jgi:cellulose 1,4-beta-cellobiosidase